MNETDRKLPHIYCFLDTNVLIEFQTYEEVKWPDILHAKHVCLVFAPIVFRELDKHKSNASNKRVQKRARMLLPKLTKHIEASATLKPGDLPVVRENVSFLAITQEPEIDWKNEHLDPAVNDDRLLASILEFSRDHPSDNIILVSDDSGPRVKAIGRNIQVLAPPEDLKRLPDLPSEVEKENEKLRQQIKELTERMPTLGLGFYENGQFVLEIVRQANTEWMAQTPEEYAAQRIERERENLERMLAQADSTVPESEVEKFKKSYETYLTRLEPALKMRYISRYAPQCRLQLVLVNGGSAPAHDIYLRFQFPEGSSILVLDKIDDELDIKDELPDEPATPAWAALPRSKWEQEIDSQAKMIQELAKMANSFRPPASLFASPTDMFKVNRNTYDDTNFPFGRDRIQREKEKLIQQRLWYINPLAVYLSTYQKDGFTIAYTIHTEEWPKPHSGELKVHWILNDSR